MKRKIALLISFTLIVMSLSACGKAADSGKRGGTAKGVADVLEEGAASEEEKTTTETKTTETVTEESSKKDDSDKKTEASTTEGKNETAAETTEKAEDNSVTENADNGNQPKEATVIPPEIDVDLTKLSSTMVYSEVYNMMVEPDSYLGKTVKMSGPFAVYTDEESGKNYFACIIQDATACCSQGIEFTLSGDYSYPEDYPAVNDIITVTGTFSTYEEDGYAYLTLLDARME